MKIFYHLDNENDRITNFSLAESVLEVCDTDHNDMGLDAEVVAKMILLQVEARKGGAE